MQNPSGELINHRRLGAEGVATRTCMHNVRWNLRGQDVQVRVCACAC